MRRAIQLRMIFSLAGEGGIEGGCRRQHDGEEVEGGIMGVATRQDQHMEQGVRGEESGTRNGCRPVSRAPCPCGECEAGHEERYADVLDEMQVKGPGFGYPRNGFVPEGTGSEHRQPVNEGGYRENCCYQTPHENLLRPRRARRPGCDGTSQRNFRAISGPNSRPKRSAIWSEFCSWQAGQDSVNSGFRACWPLRWHVRARIPKTRYGRRSFLSGHPHGLLEREETHRFGGLRQGSFGLPDGLDPVRDCRRPSRSLHGNANFSNGLILQPA